MLESEELYIRKAGEEIVDQVRVNSLNRFLLPSFLPSYLPTYLHGSLNLWTQRDNSQSLEYVYWRIEGRTSLIPSCVFTSVLQLMF